LIRLLLSFIQAGALQGEAITCRPGLMAITCFITGSTSARLASIEKRASAWSVSPGGRSLSV